MKGFLEREVKLDPGAAFTLPELPGRPLESRVFTSTYYDTPPRSLARGGITLRRRVENGLSRWQLKLPREDGRDELEAPGGPAGPPPELAALLKAHLRHGKLAPVATLRTHRSGVRVAEGERSLADVTLDAVDILDNGHAAGNFTELEVELVDGNDDDLDRLARKLRRAGAQRTDGQPKLMRVLDLTADAVPGPDAPLGEQLRFMLDRSLAELEAQDPGVRLGEDPEALHRFRVATRRARALIRSTSSFLGDALAPLGAELDWLAGLLGPVRDLDVLLARLQQEAAANSMSTAAAASRSLPRCKRYAKRHATPCSPASAHPAIRNSSRRSRQRSRRCRRSRRTTRFARRRQPHSRSSGSTPTGSGTTRPTRRSMRSGRVANVRAMPGSWPVWAATVGSGDS